MTSVSYKVNTTAVNTEHVDGGDVTDEIVRDDNVEIHGDLGHVIGEGGSALQIVSFDDNGTCQLHEENLQKILLQDDIKDRLLVVVSVVGKFRQGKSFLMTLMLNHMQRQGADWINDNDMLLDGFEWKHSSQRVTTGILMWSKSFPLDLPTEEKVAVVFMDTQGTFDRKSDPNVNRLIFAISTMMSSVQIYNVKDNIGSDDLDHFKYFTAYGKMTRDGKAEENGTDAENENEKNNHQVEENMYLTVTPFQHLWFLIRDWSNSDEFDLGADGGNAFLKTLLEPEFIDLLDSCFTSAECFLIPHPGPKVTKRDFKGKLADIDPDFKKFISAFMHRILDPSKLVIKEFGGQPVKARNFMQPVREYVETCRSGQLPEARNMFQSYADACYVAASEAAVDEFTNKMEAKFYDDADCVPEDQFEKEVFECKKDALKIYYSTLKMGETKERNEKYLASVVEAMRMIIKTKRTINECKQMKKKAEEERAEVLKQELERKEIARRLTQKMIKELKDFLLSELNQLTDIERRISNPPKSLEEQYKENAAFVEEIRGHVIRTLKITNTSAFTKDELNNFDEYYIKELKEALKQIKDLRQVAERKANEVARAKGLEAQAEMARLKEEYSNKEQFSVYQIIELTNELNEKKMEVKDSEMKIDFVNRALVKTEEDLNYAKRYQMEQKRKGYLSIALGFLTSGALATAAGTATAIVGTSAVAQAFIASAAVVGISAAVAPAAAGTAVVVGVVGTGVVVKMLVDYLKRGKEGGRK